MKKTLTTLGLGFAFYLAADVALAGSLSALGLHEPIVQAGTALGDAWGTIIDLETTMGTGELTFFEPGTFEGGHHHGHNHGPSAPLGEQYAGLCENPHFHGGEFSCDVHDHSTPRVIPDAPTVPEAPEGFTFE